MRGPVAWIRRAPPWPLAAALVFWAATLPALRLLDRAGAAAGLSSGRPRGVEEVAGMALLGGFRTIAVDFLMVRAQDHMEEGRFYEIQTLYDSVTRLVPRMESGWLYLSWNLAFNIPSQVSEPEARWRYTRKGIQLCRRGQERIPTSWRLPFLEAIIITNRCADVPDHRARLVADPELNPRSLTVEAMAMEKAWAAISIEGHLPRADKLVEQLLVRSVKRDGPGGQAAAMVDRFWRHLREDGGKRAASADERRRRIQEGEEDR